ncbi:MAG: hypothetical protein IJC93_09215 [Clostridia bacterium]|nr:hypothetical protein [Clostridia bacterium]
MFKRALPVFEAGKETEMNTFYGFYTKLPYNADTILKIAGSSVYSVAVNGEFIFTGPARAAHGYYRVDELPIGNYLKTGENVLTVRLSAYNCNSFSFLDVPGFLCAEVVQGGEVVRFTDVCDGGFGCVALDERVQKVFRYSFQRNFSEAYRLDARYALFDVSPAESGHRSVTLAVQADKTFIPRSLFLPEFSVEEPQQILGGGTVSDGVEQPLYRSREHKKSEILDCFAEDELEYRCLDEARSLAFAKTDRTVMPWKPADLTADRFADLAWRCNLTGLIELRFTVTEACELLLLFDEIYNNETVDFLRLNCANVIRIDAEPGSYHLLTQEPYVFKYLRAVCRKGSVRIDEICLRRVSFYALPDRPQIADAELGRIYDAAVETFRQNTYDVFMDCPSRERAGWLCDSFFTARVERALTGKTEVEDCFLWNFVAHPTDPDLPDGMLPMCYPSDHTDHLYIPNWAMWYVMELEEYLAFTGNRAFAEQAKSRVMGLMDFLRRYENADGLLEKLDAWVFVEWSKANDLVQDISYPTNMLYARVKRAVAAIYGDASLIAEAEKIEAYIRENTMVNGFFCDNSYRRADGSLELSGECTEACQYYAFFMNVATPETHPELWRILMTDFGPHRKADNRHPKIHFANSFIGNYLRLDLLRRYGMKEKLTEEIRGYFLHMADKTGTLWEHDGEVASCNHGFASYIAVLLRDVLGV